MKTNNKIINALILIVALILFSSIVYARPITDIFANGLVQINNFFENEGYAPYAKTIDFVFFAFLFIAIYMMGARYAFKEIKRPEQVIVILLGLMTAFLLVLADISATILLPYIHWLFYVLLFMLYWWLLKGIKSKFWRFILALLLTLLTIALLQGLYNYLKKPEAPRVPEVSAPEVGGIRGFFRDMFDSIRGVRIPGVQLPGVPDYLRGLTERRQAVTGPTPLPIVPTPAGEEVRPEEGFPWGNLLLLLLLLLLLTALGFGAYRLWKRRKPKEEKLTVEQIIAEIEETIRKKREAKQKINEKLNQKIRLIKAADKAQAFVRSYAKEDIANIWTDTVREKIRQAGAELLEFIDKEKEFVNELKELKDDVEVKLHNKLDDWKKILDANGIDANQILQELRDIIALKTTPREIKRIGIIWLILICYNYTKKEISYGKELADALREDNIEELVKDRLETVNNDEKKLILNIGAEVGIVNLLNAKIELQIEKLRELLDKIRGVEMPEIPKAPTQILTLTPTNSTATEPEKVPIEVISDYHKIEVSGDHVANALRIGKGGRNHIHLADTQIYPPNVTDKTLIENIVQAMILFNQGANKFNVGRVNDNAIIKIKKKTGEEISVSARTVLELTDGDKLTINEYEFTINVRDKRPDETIPSREDYFARFPVVLRLKEERIPTVIQDLIVTPVEAKQEPGVDYGTSIKISTVIEQGIAPFRALCYVFKFVEGKFVQVYPANRPQLKTKAEFDQSFLSGEFEEALSSKRGDREAYRRIIEFSSKAINNVSDRVEFTSKDFGNLEPGDYKVLIEVKGSTPIPKFAARKQVRIIIKKPETGQLGLDLQAPPLTLALTPTNSEPDKPIRIISNYHKVDRNEYLTIGKGEGDNIILIDTKDEAEPQVFIGFITAYNKFGLFKLPPYSTKIELYDASTGYFPITENIVLLQDGFRIKINGYEFEVGMKPMYEHVPPREKYMEQFTLGIRLKLKPKIKVLKLIPNPKKVIPDETIELIGDYHSTDDALKIGKGTDVGAPQSRRNYMHLTDTQIYPKDDINKPQAVILFDRDSGRFGIAKFTEETKIKLNNRLVEESKWLGNSGTIAINEYEFDFETEETNKIPSREEYLSQKRFPIILNLRSAEIDITHLAPSIEEGLTEFDEWLIRQEARAKRALERGKKKEYDKIISETLKEFRRLKRSLQKRIKYSNVAKINAERVEELIDKLTSQFKYVKNDKRFDHFHVALGIIYELIKLTDDSKIPVAGMKLVRKVPYSRTREKAMLKESEIGPEPFGMPPKEPWEEEALEEYRRRQAAEPKTIDERWAPLLKTHALPPTLETPLPPPEEKPPKKDLKTRLAEAAERPVEGISEEEARRILDLMKD